MYNAHSNSVSFKSLFFILRSSAIYRVHLAKRYVPKPEQRKIFYPEMIFKKEVLLVINAAVLVNLVSRLRSALIREGVVFAAAFSQDFFSTGNLAARYQREG